MQVDRLEELVEQHEEARRFYITYMDLHASLLSDSLAAEQLPSVLDELRDELRAEAGTSDSGGGSALQTPKEGSIPSRVPPLNVPTSGLLRQVIQINLLPVVLFGLLAGGLGIWIGSTFHRAVPLSLPIKAPVAVTIQLDAPPTVHRAWVATVQRSGQCEWGGDGRELPPGTRLAEGQRIVLRKGVVEIIFGKGAFIVLEGPATLEMKSSQQAFLSSGKLLAKVPPSAIGFTVEIPAAHIVDFGTEFGVQIEDSGAAEVHVFRGKVEIAPPASRSADWTQAARIELTAGHALRAAAPRLKQDWTFAPRIEGPTGITFGPDGHCYVASGRTNLILRYDGETGQPIDVFAHDGLDFPTGLTFGRDGHLYVCSFQSDEIIRLDGTNGAPIDTFVSPGTLGLNAPFALAFGPHDNHLYVTSYGSDEVLCFDGETGKPLQTLVHAGSSELDGPQGLAFGPAGHLYVASGNTNSVLCFDTHTGEPQGVTQLARDGQKINPTGVSFDLQGRLYVASGLTHQVLRIDLENRGSIEKYSTTDMTQPMGLCFDAKGRLHVSDFAASSVVRYRNTRQQTATVMIQNWKPIPFVDNKVALQRVFSSQLTSADISPSSDIGL